MSERNSITHPAAMGSSAPKGRNIPAQGNALGPRQPKNPSPEGAAQEFSKDGSPRGWRKTTLGELIRSVSINDKKLPAKQYAESGKFPVVDQGQKFIGGYSDDEHRVISDELPLIVFGDHTRIFKYLDRAFVPGADGIKVLKPIGVDAKWLFHIAHALDFPDKGYARHFQHLKQATVFVPPLPEQRRIVARIEELFSRLDAGVAALRHAKAQLQRYRQSVLAAAVTGQLTQAWREQHGLTMQDWRQTTLGDESALVTSGSRGWAKYYADDGPLFVRAQNIKTDALVLDDLAHVRPPAGSEGARTQVFENDLLITITGANVTKSALVKQPLGEAYVSQHVALVRPVNPDHAPFLYYAIISPRNGRAFLEEKAYGAGKPGLNLTNVKEVPIGLPPLAEQHQIVAEAEARTTAIDHLEAELDRQIIRSNRLRQSTLAAAFNGDLTKSYG